MDALDTKKNNLINNVESIKNLDVPLINGQIVTINLNDELVDAPDELILFLKNEKCQFKYWIIIALSYAQAEKLDESLLIIKNALEVSYFEIQDKKRIHQFLFWLYLKYVYVGIEKEKNLTNSKKSLDFLTENESDEKFYLLENAVYYYYINQWDMALSFYEKELKFNPSNCIALMGKAQIIIHKTKNYVNALKFYQQVLIINPYVKPDPRIGIGLCFWFLKDENMAILSWERALEIDKNNYKAKLLLILSKFNRILNNSISDEQFIKNYQENLDDLVLLYNKNHNDPVVLLVLVSYYFSKEEYDTVEKIINKIIFDMTGENKLTKFRTSSKMSHFQLNILSNCTMWLGRIFFAKSKFTQSQKFFHEAIKLNANNLLAKLGLGESQFNRGSIEESIITYESILKTNPKCLEVIFSLGILYSQQKSKKKTDLSIKTLERYLNLSDNFVAQNFGKNDFKIKKNNEPIFTSAFLYLSDLYIFKDINQSLNYLNKVIEFEKQKNQDVSIEILNNIGVIYFLKEDYQKANNYFEMVLDKLKDIKSENISLIETIKITLKYNLSRTRELIDVNDSKKIYKEILETHPKYFFAEIRLLFLECISDEENLPKIKVQLDKLLRTYYSDLNLRSFYGWFVKNFGKKLGLKSDLDTSHQKKTLIDYDYHDCYALISLANIYCIMARDIKETSTQEIIKKKKYYIRAIELFTKVLSIDSKNVFAAQGLAIIYIENNHLNEGIEILRKIKDSLNDITVYLNLGHALTTSKKYLNAIENYEIALTKFTDEKDSKIHTYLGKTWYLKAMSEKSINCFEKSIEYSKKALEFGSSSNSSLKFNICYVQFQLAEYVGKMPLNKITLENIEMSIENLNESLETLKYLSSDAEKHPPFPKSDLKVRENIGLTTLMNKLHASYQLKKDEILKTDEKLKEAKRFREEEEARRVIEKKRSLEISRLKEKELSDERAKLDEITKRWVKDSQEENQKTISNEFTSEKKKKKSEKTSKKQKKLPKKNIIMSDSQESD